MVRYALRRLLLLVPVVLGAAAVAFALLLLLPGDPAVALLGQEASGPDLVRFRHLLGLDRPVPIQLALYFWRIAHGDFGRSVTLSAPVLQLILSTLPATLELAFTSTSTRPVPFFRARGSPPGSCSRRGFRTP